MRPWMILLVCYLAVISAFVLAGMESALMGFISAFGVSFLMWKLVIRLGRETRDEGREMMVVSGALLDPEEVDAATKEGSLKVALHTLHFMGDPLGLDGGLFVNRLFQLIAAADVDNRRKIAFVFPDYVVAFEAAHRDVEPLRKFVKENRRG